MQKYDESCDAVNAQQNKKKTCLPTFLRQLCRQPVNNGRQLNMNHPSGHSAYACFVQYEDERRPAFVMGDWLEPPMVLYITADEALSDGTVWDMLIASCKSKMQDMGWSGEVLYESHGGDMIVPLPRLTLIPLLMSPGFRWDIWPLETPETTCEQLLARLPEKPVAGLAAAAAKSIRDRYRLGNHPHLEIAIYRACTTDAPRELAKRAFFAANQVIGDESAAVCLIGTMLDDAMQKAPEHVGEGKVTA